MDINKEIERIVGEKIDKLSRTIMQVIVAEVGSNAIKSYDVLKKEIEEVRDSIDRGARRKIDEKFKEHAEKIHKSIDNSVSTRTLQSFKALREEIGELKNKLGWNARVIPKHIAEALISLQDRIKKLEDLQVRENKEEVGDGWKELYLGNLALFFDTHKETSTVYVRYKEEDRYESFVQSWAYLMDNFGEKATGYLIYIKRKDGGYLNLFVDSKTWMDKVLIKLVKK